MSAKPTEETRPAFSVSPESRIKLPLALLASLFVACAAATGAWISVRSDVSTHGLKIHALETEVRTSRELLVRIDENVKQLKEARR
jgi:hypothetical protein